MSQMCFMTHYIDRFYKLINTVTQNCDTFNNHDAVKNYRSSVEYVRSLSCRWFPLNLGVVLVLVFFSYNSTYVSKFYLKKTWLLTFLQRLVALQEFFSPFSCNLHSQNYSYKPLSPSQNEWGNQQLKQSPTLPPHELRSKIRLRYTRNHAFHWDVLSAKIINQYHCVILTHT